MSGPAPISNIDIGFLKMTVCFVLSNQMGREWPHIAIGWTVLGIVMFAVDVLKEIRS